MSGAVPAQRYFFLRHLIAEAQCRPSNGHGCEDFLPFPDSQPALQCFVPIKDHLVPDEVTAGHTPRHAKEVHVVDGILGALERQRHVQILAQIPQPLHLVLSMLIMMLSVSPAPASGLTKLKIIGVSMASCRLRIKTL